MALNDITERQEAQRELSRERKLLSQAELIGKVGSWRTEVDGGSGEWSDEAARILGFDPSKAVEGPFTALESAVLSQDRESFRLWVTEVTSSERTSTVDVRIERTEAGMRWIGLRGALEAEDGVLVVRGVVQDVTDRKNTEEERVGHLEEVANVDRLTGLHNLRGFDLVAAQSIAQAQRANQGVGLLFCDMDGLKSINDVFGHAQGDRALRDATSVLRFTLRSADAIARIGGDEFLVLAVGEDGDTLRALNERLQDGFAFFNSTNERPYQLAMSAGTAWCEPGAACQLEELKSTADSDMYAEKARRGRKPKDATPRED